MLTARLTVESWCATLRQSGVAFSLSQGVNPQNPYFLRLNFRLPRIFFSYQLCGHLTLGRFQASPAGQKRAFRCSACPTRPVPSCSAAASHSPPLWKAWQPHAAAGFPLAILESLVPAGLSASLRLQASPLEWEWGRRQESSSPSLAGLVCAQNSRCHCQRCPCLCTQTLARFREGALRTRSGLDSSAPAVVRRAAGGRVW